MGQGTEWDVSWVIGQYHSYKIDICVTEVRENTIPKGLGNEVLTWQLEISYLFCIKGELTPHL